MHKHFIDLDNLTKVDLLNILDLAREIKNSMNGKFRNTKILSERSLLDENNLINDENL